ncbi:hypothetical protein D0N36_08520 [Hymenobacter lapidiphilus]|uniref:hypothetical protein n=1 Tax=Hymenobacter sp. CCM 8763 TaxID=2303334 RepID=UPI000E357DE7|nr:hypothetical protein [Hymenobacter sp. CCM 8763]RFP65515.1 hypothetical protein D0N36_08520 [Hymenobacter sp. CCM 8763]
MMMTLALGERTISLLAFGLKGRHIVVMDFGIEARNVNQRIHRAQATEQRPGLHLPKQRLHTHLPAFT